jgi:NADPH:quinone reductase-like Zn-dependent oxidoreductase
MKAVYVTKDSSTLKDNVEVPTPAKDEVLIKNVAVASNPKVR